MREENVYANDSKYIDLIGNRSWEAIQPAMETDPPSTFFNILVLLTQIECQIDFV